MPKKSKKPRSTDNDLPDLETRRANLLAIGMPSPYQGDTTSSSSLDDSSSSTTANEAEESSDNTGRLAKATDGLSTVACADYGKISTREEKSPDLTITSSDTELQKDSKEGEGIICEHTSSVLFKTPQYGYISEIRNTSTSISLVSSDQSYQNSPNYHLGTESSEASSIISLEQPHKDNAGKNMSWAMQAPQNPNLSKSIEIVEDIVEEKLTQSTLRRILIEGWKPEKKNKAGLLQYPDGVEANREAQENKASDEDPKSLEYSSHKSDSKPEPSPKHTAEKDGLFEGVTLESNISTISPTNLMTDASSKGNVYKITPSTKCMTGISSEGRSKSVTPTKKDVSTKVTSKSVTPAKKEVSTKAISKTVSPAKKEVSTKGRSKSVTPTKKEVSTKVKSKCVTPTKKEVSTKVKSKCGTPTKKEVSTKAKSKSVTPTKEVSSKERSKITTPTKRSKEASSKVKSKSIALVDVSQQDSREKFKRNLSSVKYSSKGTQKETAISPKPKLAAPLLEKREKDVISTADMTESPTKEKITAPTKCIPEVLSKENLKSVTPTKCRQEVAVKERTRSVKPGEHKPEASSQGKCEKSCTSAAPLKVKTKTVTPVKLTPKDSSKKRSKTPTKRMPEASSNENRARSVTPSKRTPEFLSKGETKYETQHKRTSVALSREKSEVMTKTECITEASTLSGELTNTPDKNSRAASSPEKAKKPVSPTNFIEETSCPERVPKPVIPTNSTKGYTKESPDKHSRHRVIQESEMEYGTHVKFTESDINISSEDSNESKHLDCRETNMVSFKEFKETLGVDRVPSPEINFDVFDKALGIYKDSENSSPKSPEPQQQIPAVSPEKCLEAITIALDKLKLATRPVNENITRTEPTSATESRGHFLTIEEFRSALGTDKITPVRTEDVLDVFNKALEKLEAKKRKRVTFLVPREPGPSTSRERTSPERQLDNDVSQDTEPDFSRNHTLSGGNLTFQEFHRGLSTTGYLKQELLSLDVFDKALDEMERTNSSQSAQEVKNDSCRSNPLEESKPSDSSVEDVNKAIAVSGIKMRPFCIVSSDEPKNSLKSDPSKKSNQPLAKTSDSNFCTLGIPDQIPEEDSNLSESASKSSEASLEESSAKSSEPDLVSSESVVKSSESETSPMEYMEKTPEEEVESSESAVKSTESEASNEEYTGDFKESTEAHKSERASDFEKRHCETKMGRNESPESPDDAELKSPRKRRRSERVISPKEKSRKPEFLNLGVFDKASEEMEGTDSSQSAQEVQKDSCRANPLEESKQSDSSDADLNKAISVSGMKMRRFRIVSPDDDEPKNSVKSDSSKMLNQPLAKIKECNLSATGITDQIPEDDSLSESTRKSSEASLEESSSKSSEPDLVSSESVVKSSESETSPMEYMEKSPKEEAESSESAVKSTDSETSPEEYTGDFEESTEAHKSERTSDFEKRLCEFKMGRNESPGSPDDAELKSPRKRRKSERIMARKERPSEEEQRSRSQSEKGRPGKKDSKSKKK